jgi:hypothetical protein
VGAGSFLRVRAIRVPQHEEVTENLDGTWEKVPEQTTDEIGRCGAPMTIAAGSAARTNT